ncbi:hypothetical protein [uncultured Roseobacter sp.]|uniref:hypothetical protein n=1 Tax=uncultured Roseobacter sp. TaxID=114847 RepID=UPI0026203E7A|nr:hypothetical protein [uncultured Roseobacter sp.]
MSQNDPVLLDYKRWALANSPSHFSLFDYLHGLFSTNQYPADVAIAFSELVAPRFQSWEGQVFLAEQFDLQKIEAMKDEGTTNSERQYWINLVSISDLLVNAPLDMAESFGKRIVKS